MMMGREEVEGGEDEKYLRTKSVHSDLSLSPGNGVQLQIFDEFLGNNIWNCFQNFKKHFPVLICKFYNIFLLLSTRLISEQIKLLNIKNVKYNYARNKAEG